MELDNQEDFQLFPKREELIQKQHNLQLQEDLPNPFLMKSQIKANQVAFQWPPMMSGSQEIQMQNPFEFQKPQPMRPQFMGQQNVFQKISFPKETSPRFTKDGPNPAVNELTAKEIFNILQGGMIQKGEGVFGETEVRYGFDGKDVYYPVKELAKRFAELCGNADHLEAHDEEQIYLLPEVQEYIFDLLEAHEKSGRTFNISFKERIADCCRRVFSFFNRTSVSAYRAQAKRNAKLATEILAEKKALVSGYALQTYLQTFQGTIQKHVEANPGLFFQEQKILGQAKLRRDQLDVQLQELEVRKAQLLNQFKQFLQDQLGYDQEFLAQIEELPDQKAALKIVRDAAKRKVQVQVQDQVEQVEMSQFEQVMDQWYQGDGQQAYGQIRMLKNGEALPHNIAYGNQKIAEIEAQIVQLNQRLVQDELAVQGRQNELRQAGGFEEGRDEYLDEDPSWLSKIFSGEPKKTIDVQDAERELQRAKEKKAGTEFAINSKKRDIARYKEFIAAGKKDAVAAGLKILEGQVQQLYTEGKAALDQDFANYASEDKAVRDAQKAEEDDLALRVKKQEMIYQAHVKLSGVVEGLNEKMQDMQALQVQIERHWADVETAVNQEKETIYLNTLQGRFKTREDLLKARKKKVDDKKAQLEQELEDFRMVYGSKGRKREFTMEAASQYIKNQDLRLQRKFLADELEVDPQDKENPLFLYAVDLEDPLALDVMDKNLQRFKAEYESSFQEKKDLERRLEELEIKSQILGQELERVAALKVQIRPARLDHVHEEKVALDQWLQEAKNPPEPLDVEKRTLRELREYKRQSSHLTKEFKQISKDAKEYIGVPQGPEEEDPLDPSLFVKENLAGQRVRNRIQTGVGLDLQARKERTQNRVNAKVREFASNLKQAVRNKRERQQMLLDQQLIDQQRFEAANQDELADF